MPQPLKYAFEPLSSGREPAFQVITSDAAGARTAVGTVRHIYVRHLKQYGWEATGSDGSHLAVHQHRWQAAWALTWNRKGYPFPVASSHRRDIEA